MRRTYSRIPPLRLWSGLSILAVLGLVTGLATPLSPSVTEPTGCADEPTLEARVACRVGRIHDRGPFDKPTAAARDAWRRTVSAMLEGRCEDVQLPGALRGYQIGSLRDASGRALCVLEETTESHLGWGTFVTAAGPSRPVHVLVPHPLHDGNTPAQGVGIFLGAQARSLLIAGASRYAAPAGTGCGDRPASDPTHSPHTVFQPTVEALSAAAPDEMLLQLHGMAPTSCGDVDVYLTHGSSEAPEGDDVLLQLRDQLSSRRPDWTVGLAGDGSCRLHGSLNVQGRLLTGMAGDDVCLRGDDRPTPQFVHVEQKPRAREPVVWVEALVQILPTR